MPVKTIDLAAIKMKRVRTVVIELAPGEDLEVRYKPDELTMRLQEEIAEAKDQDSAAMLMVKLLCGWNLTVDGAPYPITVDNLHALGLPILLMIATTVQEDFNTNVQLGKSTSTAPPSDSPTA